MEEIKIKTLDCLGAYDSIVISIVNPNKNVLGWRDASKVLNFGGMCLLFFLMF